MTGTFLFSGRNNDRAPARQTTGTFLFSGRNNHRAPTRQMTGTFLFSGRNNECAPARQTTGTFFFVVLRYWVCACLVRGLLPNSFVLKKHIKFAIDMTDQQAHNFSN